MLLDTPHGFAQWLIGKMSFRKFRNAAKATLTIHVIWRGGYRHLHE